MLTFSIGANMSKPMRTTDAAISIRTAVERDAADIARLFLVSSDGLAAYIWDCDRPPGLDLLAHGAARYARRGTAFSYENCTVAASGERVIAMLHAFEMPESEGIEEDPILRPYAELEDPGSLYISGIAVDAGWRGQGIGGALLDVAEDLASHRGCDRLSLICFEENQDALRLYRRRGYEEIDRRPIAPHPCLHHTEGDALLMRLARMATG